MLFRTPDPAIDLKVDAFLPGTFVPDPKQKVEIYKKIAGIRELRDAGEVYEEIEDRFGDLPAAVVNLLAVAKFKVLAKQAGVAQIGSERGEVVIRFLAGLSLGEEKALEIVRKFRGQVRVATGKLPVIRVKVGGLGDGEMLKVLQDVAGTI